MADEIKYAGIADLTTAEAIGTEYLYLLASRRTLPGHNALMYVGDIKGSGSKVIKVPHIGLMGYDDANQVSVDEADNEANTALTDGSSTVTPVRQTKAYEASDVAKMVEPNGLLSPQMFAQDAVITASIKLTDLIVNVTDGFTSTVGTTGVDMDTAVWLAAQATLEIANAAEEEDGESLSVIHGQQWADLRKDMVLALGGAGQFDQSVRQALQFTGSGYKGNILGTDLFVNNRVPTDGSGNRAGGMWTRGGVLWGDMTVEAESSVDQLVVGNKVLFERDRTARQALTAYIMHTWLGVSKGLDGRGVTIATDQ